MTTTAPALDPAEHVSPGLKHLFDSEIENYASAVRNGDLKPWEDGFVPTLASAVDSWQQADDDMVAGWLGIDEDDLEVDIAWAVSREAVNLAWLITLFGPDQLLSTFVPDP
jgi:hypothetical protein